MSTGTARVFQATTALEEASERPEFSIHFQNEPESNSVRDLIAVTEPHSLRTFTPSQAVLAKSAGCFHWTPEGRRLYDFTSGVLVANLGHNPRRWMLISCKALAMLALVTMKLAGPRRPRFATILAAAKIRENKRR